MSRLGTLRAQALPASCPGEGTLCLGAPSGRLTFGLRLPASPYLEVVLGLAQVVAVTAPLLSLATCCRDGGGLWDSMSR